MALVTFQLAPGVDGGTVNQGDGQAFDVGHAVTLGGGSFAVDDTVDSFLAAALKASSAVVVVGARVVTPVVTTKVIPVMTRSSKPGDKPGDVLIRAPDGIFDPVAGNVFISGENMPSVDGGNPTSSVVGTVAYVDGGKVSSYVGGIVSLDGGTVASSSTLIGGSLPVVRVDGGSP